LYFEISALVGGMTVEELLKRISSRELTEWAAYFKIRHDEDEKAMRDARR